MKTIEPVRVKTENQASDVEKKGLEAFKDLMKSIRRTFDKLESKEIPASVYIDTQIEGDAKFTFGMIDASIFMKSVETKDMLAGMMKQIGKEIDPVCICLVTECWMVEEKAGAVKNLDDYKGLTPSEHPDRLEAVLYSFESENILMQAVDKIVRVKSLFPGGGEEISLVPWKDLDTMDHIEGRFSNVLKDMKKIKQN